MGLVRISINLIFYKHEYQFCNYLASLMSEKKEKVIEKYKNKNNIIIINKNSGEIKTEYMYTQKR